jgi:4-amino-4-deoxy-L-arabinose transferase-like glycosyltransferase
MRNLATHIEKIEAYLRKPRTMALFLVSALLLFLGFFRLETVPAPWWDEGWTISHAKNWVELNHYGRLLIDEPAPAGLSAHFPVVSQVALSFKLFGIGIWQARLPGILFTFAALTLIYHLAKKLYNPTIAYGTLFSVLFLLTLPQINPILSGRQVLGDMPLAFYLLAGYVSFMAAWKRPLMFLPLTIFFWGVSINIKAQTFPFWLLAMLVPLLVASLKRSWYSVLIISSAILGSWIISEGLVSLQNFIIRDISLLREPLEGLYQAVAFVTAIPARMSSLAVLVHSGLPTLFALVFITWGFIKGYKRVDLTKSDEVVKLSLLVFSGTWFAWFLLLSTGGPRYMSTPGFMAGIFVSVMLFDYSAKFNFKLTVLRAAQFLKLKQLDLSGVKALLTVFMVGPLVIISLISSYGLLFEKDDSLAQAVHYLNTFTLPGSLIESYESEIFFLLDRPYHYPPDQLHLEWLIRWTQDMDLEVHYDPLASDPDYLVYGPVSATWNLYDEVIQAGEFKPIMRFSRYIIYERVR